MAIVTPTSSLHGSPRLTSDPSEAALLSNLNTTLARFRSQPTDTKSDTTCSWDADSSTILTPARVQYYQQLFAAKAPIAQPAASSPSIFD